MVALPQRAVYPTSVESPCAANSGRRESRRCRPGVPRARLLGPGLDPPPARPGVARPADGHLSAADPGPRGGPPDPQARATPRGHAGPRISRSRHPAVGGRLRVVRVGPAHGSRRPDPGVLRGGLARRGPALLRGAFRQGLAAPPGRPPLRDPASGGPGEPGLLLPPGVDRTPRDRVALPPGLLPLQGGQRDLRVRRRDDGHRLLQRTSLHRDPDPDRHRLRGLVPGPPRPRGLAGRPGSSHRLRLQPGPGLPPGPESDLGALGAPHAAGPAGLPRCGPVPGPGGSPPPASPPHRRTTRRNRAGAGAARDDALRRRVRGARARHPARDPARRLRLDAAMESAREGTPRLHRPSARDRGVETGAASRTRSALSRHPAVLDLHPPALPPRRRARVGLRRSGRPYAARSEPDLSEERVPEWRLGGRGVELRPSRSLWSPGGEGPRPIRDQAPAQLPLVRGSRRTGPGDPAGGALPGPVPLCPAGARAGGPRRDRVQAGARRPGPGRGAAPGPCLQPRGCPARRKAGNSLPGRGVQGGGCVRPRHGGAPAPPLETHLLSRRSGV
jgi:hypothetical protein